MKSNKKSKIIKIFFVLIFFEVIIGVFLFKSRSISHLAICRIVESDKEADFYWSPDKAPDYFYFEPDTEDLKVFRRDILPLLTNKNDKMETVIEIASYMRYLMAIKPQAQTNPFFKWDSPEGMLRQMKQGAIGSHCFHRSILFSTYLSSLGFKSRLWTLEDLVNGKAHTISEVYVNEFDKWVFTDINLGFYVTKNGRPLSFLELRREILNNNAEKFSVHYFLNHDANRQMQIPSFYKQLIKCAFLRANNDFVSKYNPKIRFGNFYLFSKYLDKLPNSMRIGLSYLLGGKDIFIHYVDGQSGSLKIYILLAKLLFYSFIFLVLTTIFFIGQIIFLAINFSTKHVRHR